MKQLILLVSLCVYFYLPSLAQDSGSRQIVPEEFVKARPHKSGASPARRTSYRSTSTAKTVVAKNGNFE